VKRYNWRLPEGVEELLPPRAWELELIRRNVLDLFRTWGYEYVEPPIIEFLDALLVAGGHDLDLQTIKVVDQRSGQMMGVRADMTSQAARIDAHSLRRDGVTRLCYAGTVVHANPLATLESRVPIKAGAELFGDASIYADAEVIVLMIETLRHTGVERPVVVVGHMGVYASLVGEIAGEVDERALFAAIQNKSETDVKQLIGAGGGDELVRLPTLMGPAAALPGVRGALSSPDALRAVDALEQLVQVIAARCPEVELRFDLAELAGYGYHNGPVFAAFHGAHGRVLARGGRYDGIGGVFGRSRPATGFDLNLTRLLQGNGGHDQLLWAPWAESARAGDLAREVARLRAAGLRVAVALGAGDRPPAGCTEQLVPEGDGWHIRAIQ
jgi:ATP phosphoribosyltransferase regulatory subunit